MSRKQSRSVIFAALLLAVVTTGATSHAATVLSGSFTAEVVTNFDLDNPIYNDWAIWDTTTAKASKVGASIINETASIAGTEHTTFTGRHTFDYNATVGDNAALVVNAGGTRSITLNFTLTEGDSIIQVFAKNRLGATNVTAAIGALTELTTVTDGGTNEDVDYRYTLNITDAGAGDTLSITFLAMGAQPSRGPRIQAATYQSLTVIPAPAALPAGLALMALVGLRRRRHV